MTTPEPRAIFPLSAPARAWREEAADRKPDMTARCGAGSKRGSCRVILGEVYRVQAGVLLRFFHPIGAQKVTIVGENREDFHAVMAENPEHYPNRRWDDPAIPTAIRGPVTDPDGTVCLLDGDYWIPSAHWGCIHHGAGPIDRQVLLEHLRKGDTTYTVAPD